MESSRLSPSIHRDRQKVPGLALMLLLLVITGFSLYAWLGLERVTADIVGAKLPMGCELFFFGEDTQPVFTIALGCPGHDLIRLWPWPITNPWFEDWWEIHRQGLIAFELPYRSISGKYNS